MSLHPTSRERQTGGETPHDLAAQQDYAAVARGASVIDAPAGQPGWVSVRRTPGRAPSPFDSLTGDPSAVSRAPVQPPIRVEIRPGGKP